MSILKRIVSRNSIKNLQIGGYGDICSEWVSLSEKKHYLEVYKSIPDIHNIISYTADQMAKVIWKMTDEKGQHIEKHPLITLLNNPNPLQGKSEWMRDYCHNYDVFGNAYIKSVAPLGFENIADKVQALYVLPSKNMQPIGTGKFYEETTAEKIIKKYVYTVNGIKQDIDRECIIHKANVNIDIEHDNYLEGMSKLKPLQKSISNLKAAYEANNVLITKRGAIGAISPDTKDADGFQPLLDSDKKDLQDDYRKYGLVNRLWQVLISTKPIRWIPFGFKSSELMLFENMEEATMKIADAYDFPILILASLKGGTFSNLDAAKKQLFENNIIPKAEDLADELSRYFNLADEKVKLIPSYEHVGALQQDRLVQATVSDVKSKGIKTIIEAYRLGLGIEGMKLILINDFGFTEKQAETIVNDIDRKNNLE